MTGRWSEVVALLEGAVGTVFPSAALVCGRGPGTNLSFAVGAASLETWFDLASLTKALSTSLLCMQLAQQGRLMLDEEVLPGVSVEVLLSHVSGLPPGFLPSQGGDSKGQAQALAASPGDASRRRIVEMAAETERLPVGQRAIYSDLGFILLGDFLEQRAGDRLDVQFARLATALELDIGFRPLDAAPQSLPAPASRIAPTRRESDLREPLLGVVHDDNARAMLGVAGHAGLFGTAAGVARLTEALFDTYHGRGHRPISGRSLGISAETLRRFWALPPATAPAGATFGLGWDHPTPHDPCRGPGPGSGVSSAGQLWPRAGVGHLGFTGCSLWLDPPTRTFVVFLSNRVAAATSSEAFAAQAGMKALRPALHDAVLRAYGL